MVNLLPVFSKYKFLIALFIVLCGLNAYAAKLVDPSPITVPEGTTIEQIQTAIQGAIDEKNWQVENQIDQLIEASYSVRSHKLTMAISYTSSQIQFEYKDSVNLKYKEKKGKKHIHRNYMPWTQSLADQIARNIAMGEGYTPIKFETKPLPPARPRAFNDATENAKPKESFSAFGKFQLEAATLSEGYNDVAQHNGATRNLTINLDNTLMPQLAQWQRHSNSDRALVIRPNVERIKFIGNAARVMIGGHAGESWMTVRVSFVDAATGDLVAEPLLYRKAGQASRYIGAKLDYKMVEDMAQDIKQYMMNNYDKPMGGGAFPPAQFR
ncbi:hypothetical protein [Marinibactrum halimedae]|uniref:DUF4468 domain-containing protein n=1 Tax=Marinibactrum halimedae TaxID=1444977 RepID=A0AA37TF14_9GAMM|nr:hypothetical protein [Marinibactrum halimedae]MCD9460636.1 hypothetical protein [Marinibactrum halimedae]GLS27852.1 hypothetical protein GCM10007877_35710 [Marinibactrum halimedae]